MNLFFLVVNRNKFSCEFKTLDVTLIGMIVRCARFPWKFPIVVVVLHVTLFNISPYEIIISFFFVKTNKLEQNWIASVLYEPFNNVHAIGIVVQPLTDENSYEKRNCEKSLKEKFKSIKRLAFFSCNFSSSTFIIFLFFNFFLISFSNATQRLNFKRWMLNG